MHTYIGNQMVHMQPIIDMLRSEFTTINARFRTVSIIHVKDLETELEAWRHEGIITKKFYEQNYNLFRFHPPETLQNARSIVIIGIPQKITRIEFFSSGKRYQTIIPPTYIFSEIRETCKEILSRVLSKHGYSVERAILPMKLLSVKSGLGQYGKNNLCYVEGMGSYTRLEGFYTDYEFPTDDWGETKLMDSCSSCSLCQQVCPTHCIPADRILLHADQCLTYFNENDGDFPPSVPVTAHNALIGCMRCQIVCPQNKQLLEYNKDIVRFTEEETSFLLRNETKERIPRSLAKKLTDINLYEDYTHLQRNIRVLMNG